MTDNVVDFPGITRLDLPPDRVLEAAVGEMSAVIVIGYTKDDDEYFASSISDNAQVLWLIERLKSILLDSRE